MSRVLVPVDTFTEAIVTPEVGDRSYPTTVPTALQGIVNQTRWLHLTATGTYAANDDTVAANAVSSTFGNFKVPPSSRMGPMNPLKKLATQIMANFNSTRRMVHGLSSGGTILDATPTSVMPTVSADDWETNFESDTGLTYWRQVSVLPSGPPTAHPFSFRITGLPPAGVMRRFAMYCNGSPISGSHAGLPQYMPRFRVYRVSSSSASLLFTQEDESPDLSTYEDFHEVRTDSVEIGIDQTSQYWVVLNGEHGPTGLALAFKMYSFNLLVSET